MYVCICICMYVVVIERQVCLKKDIEFLKSLQHRLSVHYTQRCKSPKCAMECKSCRPGSKPKRPALLPIPVCTYYVFLTLSNIYIYISHIYFGIIINKCDFSPGTNSKSKRTHMRGGTSATKRQRTTQTPNQSHPSRLNIPCHTCAYIA